MTNHIENLVKIYNKLAAQQTPYDVLNGSRTWCQGDHTPDMDSLANMIGEAEAELRELENKESEEMEDKIFIDPTIASFRIRKPKLDGYDISFEFRLYYGEGIRAYLVNDERRNKDYNSLEIKVFDDPDHVKPFIKGLREMFPGVKITFKVQEKRFIHIGEDAFIDEIFS